MAANLPTLLILNSAQSKYPRGDDPWVQATERAFSRLSEKPATVLTSISPLMWDFATYLAAEHDMRIRLVIPDYDRTEAASIFTDTITAFEIPATHASPLHLKSTRSLSRGDVWRLRDRTAILAADIIYPIAIRPGGRLENLLKHETNGADIRNEFSIDWRSGIRRRTPRYDFEGAVINPFPDGDWLVHWTRSSPGPWPGEKASEFFRDMLKRPAIYVRSARETLALILQERVIRASSWKISSATPVVSLTENTPETAVTLMRWRKRFVRYTYEPYGIAIRQGILADKGARKVAYAVRAGNPGENSWFTQSPGVVTDWTREHEWRFLGDIPLDRLDPRDWFAIVPGRSDASYLEGQPGGIPGRSMVLFQA